MRRAKYGRRIPQQHETAALPPDREDRVPSSRERESYVQPIPESVFDRAFAAEHGQSKLLALALHPPLQCRPTLHIHLQRRDKRLLRNIDLAELAHALLAFLLLVQELALARHVAAVAFRRDV